jgi:hypothetical protein
VHFFNIFVSVFSALGPQSVVASLPLALNLTVQFSGRSHVMSLSLAAARQISTLSPSSHGLVSWATDVDPFRWASSPALVLASDVLLFAATHPAQQRDLLVTAPVTLAIALSAPNPNTTTAALACAQWDENAALWTTATCSLLSYRLSCCLVFGVLFSIVFKNNIQFFGC